MKVTLREFDCEDSKILPKDNAFESVERALEEDAIRVQVSQRDNECIRIKTCNARYLHSHQQEGSTAREERSKPLEATRRVRFRPQRTAKIDGQNVRHFAVVLDFCTKGTRRS